MDRKRIPDPGKMIVQLTVGELDEIVTAAVTRALGDQPPGKTPVPTRAGGSDVKHETLHACTAMPRKGRPIPPARPSYYFTQEDLEQILAKSAHSQE